MKRLAAALLSAALVLCGCDSIPETGKPTNSSAAETSATILVNGENVPSEDGSVLYDSCGVTLKVTGFSEDRIFLRAENKTDVKKALCSLYVECDGVCHNRDSIVSYLDPGGSDDLVFAPSMNINVRTLRTRFMLIETDTWKYIDGSLSDPVTVRFSDKNIMNPDPLGTVFFENDDIKLSLVKTAYSDDGEDVTLTLFAVNKTDRDIYLRSSNLRCEHSDFTATISGVIPAGGRGWPDVTVRTYNHTISAAELDRMTFDLIAYEAGGYMTGTSYENEVTYSGITLELPRSGRPEVTVPDRITEAVPLEEFKQEFLDEYSSELPMTSAAKFSHDGGSVKLDYVFGVRETTSSADRYRLFFKARNELDKQITFDCLGYVNGIFLELTCSGSIPAMTEDYIEVRFKAPDSGFLGDLTDADLSFEYSYDDGRTDGSSLIGRTPLTRIAFSDELNRPKAPGESKLVWSDGTTDLYLLGFTDKNGYLRGEFLAVNSSEEYYSIYLSSPEGTGLSFYGKIPAPGKSASLATVTVHSVDSDEDLTPDMVSGKKITVTVYDTEYNTAAEGDGQLW
ncbi:MAG: hypothetical protein IKP47_10930 [Ruminococcus sp.]|nr:hypothetical protein [Ruminococcus sp.]